MRTMPDTETRGAIRALRPGDIPALVSLRRRAFRLSERGSPQALDEYFRTVFLENPWFDPTLPSLVHENEQGDVTGFLGVLPRRMTWNGRRIRVAVGTQLMVSPHEPGIVSRRIARVFVDGPQDLALADTANDAAQRIWTSVAGVTSATLSLTWSRPLRPLRHALELLGPGAAARAARAALTPLAGWFERSPARAEPVEVLTPDGACRIADDVFSAFALRPGYDVTGFAWLLARAREKRQFGPLESGLVRDARGEGAGWFLYHIGDSRVAHVLQVAAHPHHLDHVLRAMFRHAWSRGAIALTGRAEPWMLRGLAATGHVSVQPGPWTLLYSRDPGIAHAIERGTGYVSRLDGEWWLSF